MKFVISATVLALANIVSAQWACDAGFQCGSTIIHRVLFGSRISRTQKSPSGELVKTLCGTSSVAILIEPFLLCNIAQVGVFTLATLEEIDVKGAYIIIQVLL
ncbi:hypothetical protein A0O28_0009770 [Trichoderma guizhouense]|uniref:SSCRP protein n=1 Tax=Trichoderma guizhouense TaxID=1491466 RepID=A0A1T3CIH2_9HYPO|nr:hypothetical protein A0O28_0009770 [Trichoderma guizhouense]